MNSAVTTLPSSISSMLTSMPPMGLSENSEIAQFVQSVTTCQETSSAVALPELASVPVAFRSEVQDLLLEFSSSVQDAVCTTPIQDPGLLPEEVCRDFYEKHAEFFVRLEKFLERMPKAVQWAVAIPYFIIHVVLCGYNGVALEAPTAVTAGESFEAVFGMPLEHAAMIHADADADAGERM